MIIIMPLAFEPADWKNANCTTLASYKIREYCLNRTSMDHCMEGLRFPSQEVTLLTSCLDCFSFSNFAVWYLSKIYLFGWIQISTTGGQMHSDTSPYKVIESSGYGRRLMFERSWVRILAQYTGWTLHFIILICCKNFYCVFEKTENKRGWPIFLKKITWEYCLFCGQSYKTLNDCNLQL